MDLELLFVGRKVMDISMRGFLKKSLILLLIIVFFAGYIVIDDNTVNVNEYELYSKKYSKEFDNYTIAFISDFHNSYYYEQIIKKVQEQAPNIILLGGDMITIGKPDRKNTLALIDGLKEVAPIYFVTGNHESMNTDGSEFITELEAKGVTMIYNDSSPITINSDGTMVPADAYNKKKTADMTKEEVQQSLYIHSILDYSVLDDKALDNMDDYFKSLLERKQVEVVENGFNIMLLHRANLFDYIDDFGYDLVLAGHIHGGVIRLPFIGGILSPDRNELFPKYTKGLYYGDESRMIVNGGSDLDLAKPRIFNGPEIVTIKLRRAE